MPPDQTAPVDKYYYEVQRKGATGSVKGETAAREATVSGLIPGATYGIAVYAIKNTALSETTVLDGVTLSKLNRSFTDVCFVLPIYSV